MDSGGGGDISVGPSLPVTGPGPCPRPIGPLLGRSTCTRCELDPADLFVADFSSWPHSASPSVLVRRRPASLHAVGCDPMSSLDRPTDRPFLPRRRGKGKSRFLSPSGEKGKQDIEQDKQGERGDTAGKGRDSPNVLIRITTFVSKILETREIRKYVFKI